MALYREQVQSHAEQLDIIVSQTLTTSEEMQAAISETSRQAMIVSDAAQVSMDVSKTGQEAVSNTVSGMDTIKHQVDDITESILTLTKRIDRVGEIIQAVEDIVSKSDVLAINASIQAARAGNMGVGFAVVSREIRKLAEQSRSATAKISGILNEIQIAANNAVSVTKDGSIGAEKGMEVAGHAGESISQLSAIIEESAKMAIQISISTNQQAKAVAQLVNAVKSIKEKSNLTSSSFSEFGLN